MSFFKKHQFKRKKRHSEERFDPLQNKQEMVHPENTGSESAYFQSLVDSHAKVTVVLVGGEQFRGHIRYHDRHCFSIGLSAQGPRILLRKENISHICEE